MFISAHSQVEARKGNKMKIIMNQEEILIVLRKSFPPELIPQGHKVVKLETKGYPEREYEITVEKED